MHVILGAFLSPIASAINGLFALPMKLARRWSRENAWLSFSLLTMVSFPCLVAFRR